MSSQRDSQHDSQDDPEHDSAPVHAHAPAPAHAPSGPGLALWRVTNAWQRRVRSALAPHGLTHVQYVLLATLAAADRAHPVTQRDLADRVGADVMMTSEVLRVLESQGWITRAPHPTDRRALALTATAEGAALAARATRDVEAADSDYFGALPPSRLSAFVDALRDLSAGSAERGGDDRRRNPLV